MWRLLISVSLRLFLGVVAPAAAHGPLVIALAVMAIVFLVPPPRPADPRSPGAGERLGQRASKQ
jgi:hypothetical protein